MFSNVPQKMSFESSLCHDDDDDDDDEEEEEEGEEEEEDVCPWWTYLFKVVQNAMVQR